MPDVAISRIKVNVSERQREDMGDIKELAESIKEFGLLEPVLLDNDCNLVAGMRRLTACAALGMDTVKAEFLGQLTPIRSKLIELEENVRRKQLEWKEEADAIAELHRLKMAEDPTWTAEKTALTVGKSRRTVFNAIELSDALPSNPEVAKAETQAGAMLRLKAFKQIEKRKEDAKVRQLREGLGIAAPIKSSVVCGDALEFMKAMPAEYVDMVVTNPPFGVDIESVFKGERTIYADSEETIVPLIKGVVEQAFRVLKPDRWFVMFYPTARLDEGAKLLSDAGFAFQKVPCIWYKPNKFVSALSQPYQNFSIQYETFFWARKGEPRFHKLRLGDVFVYDTPEGTRLHPLQMPVGLWEEIIEIGTVTNENVLEPFAGSGSCGVACVKKERNYAGIELSQEYADRANMWINEFLTGVAKPEPSTEAELKKEAVSF